jgi:hypothetical protein
MDVECSQCFSLLSEYMPDEQSWTIPQLAAVTKGVIGYEGIIKQSSYKAYENLKFPWFQGDGLALGSAGQNLKNLT